MSLSEYYRLLNDFYETLRVFLEWNVVWKASVLSATDPVNDIDFDAKKHAEAVWKALEEIHTHLVELHRALNIPAAVPEMPIEEREDLLSAKIPLLRSLEARLS